MTRTFDLSGQRTLLVSPSGRQVGYSYDRRGRVTAVRNVVAPNGPANAAGVDLLRYTYTGDRRARVEMANGLVMGVRFDGLGRALEQTVTGPAGAVVWRSQRLRDGAGSTRVESAQTRRADRSRKLALDSLYRLTHYQDVPANWVDPAPLAPPPTPVDPTAVRGQALLDAAIGPLALPGDPPVFEYDDHGNRLQTRASTPRSTVSPGGTMTTGTCAPTAPCRSPTTGATASRRSSRRCAASARPPTTATPWVEWWLR
jgi:YD repeat-containing protein